LVLFNALIMLLDKINFPNGSSTDYK